MRAIWILMVASSLARADSSVPSAAGARASCRWEDSRLVRDSQLPAVKRARERVPGGLWFLQAGRRHLLFGTTWASSPPGTLVLDGDRTVMQTRFSPAGLVERADGELVGVLRIDAGNLVLARKTGPETRVPFDARSYDSASVILDGDGCTTFIGLYHRIATGSALIAIDACAGKLRWQATVQQMNVGHSKYFNEVTLERRGDEIVMHGIEAAGCYEQAFDAASGALRRSTFDRKW